MTESSPTRKPALRLSVFQLTLHRRLPEPRVVATWPRGLFLDVAYPLHAGPCRGPPSSWCPRSTPLASSQEYHSEAQNQGKKPVTVTALALENIAVLPGIAKVRKRKTSEENTVDKLFRREKRETV